MSGFFNQFLREVATGDTIKDWRHATKLFVDGLYRLSPKFQNLFHVYIDLDSSIVMDKNIQTEIGMLAKSVQLPKFSIATKTYNQYNRKSISQEKINYDPVTLTFHDDSSDVVRNFWYSYYSYYYRDADHQESQYLDPHRYESRPAQNWGFSPKSFDAKVPNYIKAIRIYSLHQKSFSAYTLIRPMITSFAHGQHTAGNYELMEHSMTVAYEAVHYTTGSVREGTVVGFGDLHYDKSPSPLTSLGGGTTSILGPGGLIQSSGDFINNLQNGNFLGAAIGGLRTFNNFKNADLKSVATSELLQTGMNILRGQNPTSSVFVPTLSSISGGLSKAVTSLVNPNTQKTNFNNPFPGLPSSGVNSGQQDAARLLGGG